MSHEGIQQEPQLHNEGESAADLNAPLSLQVAVTESDTQVEVVVAAAQPDEGNPLNATNAKTIQEADNGITADNDDDDDDADVSSQLLALRDSETIKKLAELMRKPEEDMKKKKEAKQVVRPVVLQTVVKKVRSDKASTSLGFI